MITYEQTQSKEVASIHYNGFHIGYLTKGKLFYTYQIGYWEDKIPLKEAKKVSEAIEQDYKIICKINNEIARGEMISFKRLLGQDVNYKPMVGRERMKIIR